MQTSLQAVGETIQSRGGELLNAVFSSVAGIINIVVLFVIVPVVAVYLLLDWDNMIERRPLLGPNTRMRGIKSVAHHKLATQRALSSLTVPKRFKTLRTWSLIRLTHSASGASQPRRAHAARTVFRSKHAMVMGPTPPGTGVIDPAI